MPEHARRDEEESEESSPVEAGLSAGDFAHVGIEGTIDAARGGTEAASWGGLTHHLGHEMAEVMAGDAKLAGGTIAANGILGPAAVAGGIMEALGAIDAWKHGDTTGAILGGLSAASSTTGGVSSIAALAGSGAAAGVGSVALSAGAGLKVGHYGDEQVKKLGWLHDAGGEAQSASGWAGDAGSSADDAVNNWVTKHSRSHLLGRALGTGAGLVTTLGASIPGAAMAVGGAAVGAYDKVTGVGRGIGSSLANDHRADHYAGYADNGIRIGDGAQAMADYDDKQEEAVARSKREHPERWGPTWASQLDQFARQARGESPKK